MTHTRKARWDARYTLIDAGWEHSTRGWHRGERAAGDRYWPTVAALHICRAEIAAGETLWPGDENWPKAVRPDGSIDDNYPF